MSPSQCLLQCVHLLAPAWISHSMFLHKQCHHKRDYVCSWDKLGLWWYGGSSSYHALMCLRECFWHNIMRREPSRSAVEVGGDVSWAHTSQSLSPTYWLIFPLNPLNYRSNWNQKFIKILHSFSTFFFSWESLLKKKMETRFIMHIPVWLNQYCSLHHKAKILVYYISRPSTRPAETTLGLFRVCIKIRYKLSESKCML